MLTYAMDKRGDHPRYYYLYKQMKEDILAGRLKTNEKLPSKRSLAEHLGISLITVENAYQMLKEEGYIESRPRSGYYVSEIKILGSKPQEPLQLQLLELEMDKRHLQERENFAYSRYFKVLRGVISEYGDTLFEKSPNEGCSILRNAIAEYLLRYRGVFAQPSQIIIGSGAEHLYGEVVRLLGNDKVYGIEDPSYLQIQKVYEGMGASYERLPMGKDGIKSEVLAASHADVLHVTPFHSFPSGVTASISKRYEYLEWAKLGKHMIVEDDFDSEFFMPGKPIETLFMLDTEQSVIYINTFSNSLSPAIRMGYMILPERFLEQYKEKSGAFSCTVPVLEQYALAEFINKGYFEQHLNRVRRNKKRS